MSEGAQGQQRIMVYPKEAECLSEMIHVVMGDDLYTKVATYSSNPDRDQRAEVRFYLARFHDRLQKAFEKDIKS